MLRHFLPAGSGGLSAAGSHDMMGKTPKEALCAALGKALPTVMTSGIILITAGYIIGRLCSIYYISSIGLLVSRGALMSMILVLTLLPALLGLFDPSGCRGRPKNSA